MANGGKIPLNGVIKTSHQAAKGVGGWAGTFVAGYMALAAAGAPLPTPAWSSDVAEVQDQITIIRIENLENAILQIDNQLYQINADIQAIRDRGDQPPQYMIQRLDQLDLLRVKKQIEFDQLIRNRATKKKNDNR